MNAKSSIPKIALGCLIFSSFIVIRFIVEIIQFYFDVRNPLIPSYLFEYVAYPKFLLIVVFGIISHYMFKVYRFKREVNKLVFYSVVVFCFIYFLYGGYIFRFIRELISKLSIYNY